MKSLRNLIFVVLVSLPLTAYAELPWQLSQHTRYMALGDSLAAGYGAVPAAQGYAYQLYASGVFDTVPNTLLSNAGIPGTTSRDILEHQLPQAIKALREREAVQPTFITLLIGGNDLLQILNGADPNQVLTDFQLNLTEILGTLRAALPHTRIYVGNLYTIPQIPGADDIVPVFNDIIAGVADAFDVPWANVYKEFLGKKDYLLINRRGADQFEVHPSNAGHRAIARAFRAVIE
ncbi:MAG: SGNH/GDSL hydrolase family protein [Deltaproteobacteria bacterium]|nr:SGNH/GDSL hydrolase family protein [Deltaproteobacteria bacterium]